MNNLDQQLLWVDLKNQGILGRSDGGDVKHITVGYNFKYTNLQAAMGLAQLSTLKKRAYKLKKINRLYKKKLKNVKNLEFLKYNFSGGEVPLWTDVYALKKRDELINFLKSNGVICRKYWYPLHFQKPFRESNKKYKNSSSIYKKLFWLPSSSNLNNREISYVCDLIKKFYKVN